MAFPILQLLALLGGGAGGALMQWLSSGASKPTGGTTPEGISKVPTVSPEITAFQKELLPQLKKLLAEPTYTGKQTEAMKTALGAIGPLGQYMKGFKPFDFAPIEKQAMGQFQRQIVPSIAERFTSQGIGQRSSAFPQLLGQAGGQLAENLASMKSQIGLQREGTGLNLLQNLLGIGLRPQTEKALINPLMAAAFQPSFQSVYQPRTPGFAESLLGTGLGGMGQGFGYWGASKLFGG